MYPLADVPTPGLYYWGTRPSPKPLAAFTPFRICSRKYPDRPVG